MAAYIFFCVLEISASLSILGSLTSTIPTFGSIVQNGKFAASAAYDFVNALNKVDFPIFGNHTIQTFIYPTQKESKNNTISVTNPLTKTSINVLTLQTLSVSFRLKNRQMKKNYTTDQTDSGNFWNALFVIGLIILFIVTLIECIIKGAMYLLGAKALYKKATNKYYELTVAAQKTQQ